MLRRIISATLLGLILPLTALAATPRDMLVEAWHFDDIITLDPQAMFEISSFEIVGNLYDTLVRFDPRDPTKIESALAERWTVDDTARHYTFQLRAGVTFQSGRPLTAHDVAFSFQRLLAMNAAPAFLLRQLGPSTANMHDTIKAVDDSTFVLTVDQPFAPSFVLSVLTSANFSVVDSAEVKAHVTNNDFGRDWLKTHSAGSGPFRLVTWKPTETIVVQRFDDYWRGAPALKRIVWRHITEPATQRLLLTRGDIDIARNLPADQLDPLRANPDLAFTATPQGTNFYLGLNLRYAPFTHPQVREAFKYLVNYRAMVNSFLRENFVINQTFLPFGMLGSLDESPFVYNPDKARGLLAQAGYPDGFPVTLDVAGSWPTLEIAQALQASFKPGGINIEILAVDKKTALTRYRARKHQMFLGRWATDYFDPNSNAVFSINTNNADDAPDKSLAWRNAWADPEITALAQALVLERDPARRAAGYQKLIRLHWQRAPFVMLFQQTAIAAYNKRVHGFRLGPSADSTDYAGVSKD